MKMVSAFHMKATWSLRLGRLRKWKTRACQTGLWSKRAAIGQVAKVAAVTVWTLASLTRTSHQEPTRIFLLYQVQKTCHQCYLSEPGSAVPAGHLLPVYQGSGSSWIGHPLSTTPDHPNFYWHLSRADSKWHKNLFESPHERQLTSPFMENKAGWNRAWNSPDSISLLLEPSGLSVVWPRWLSAQQQRSPWGPPLNLFPLTIGWHGH